MSTQYRTVYEADGQWWISKPQNGGELLPVDVVAELNRLLKQVEAAKHATELVRGPLMGEIERLRYAVEQRESRIADLEAQLAECKPEAHR